jgi:hypothetical protein
MDARRRVRSACRVMMINGANLEGFSQRMASAAEYYFETLKTPMIMWIRQAGAFYALHSPADARRTNLPTQTKFAPSYSSTSACRGVLCLISASLSRTLALEAGVRRQSLLARTKFRPNCSSPSVCLGDLFLTRPWRNALSTRRLVLVI